MPNSPEGQQAPQPHRNQNPANLKTALRSIGALALGFAGLAFLFYLLLWLAS